MTNSSCAFFSRLSSPSREESEIPQQVESPTMSWMYPSDPSLSSSVLRHESGTGGTAFSVTLVREDPSCPNRSEALLFHSLLFHFFVLTRVHTFISFMYWFSTCIASSHSLEAMHPSLVVLHVIIVGHLCKTRFFHCWSTFKRLQTTNSSQCLPYSTYHCQDTVLGNVASTD